MSKYALKTPSQSDYDFLKQVHHITLKEHITKIWGWDEDKQDAFFKEEFATGLIQIIQSSASDIGYLLVDEKVKTIAVVELLILPEFQNRGIGSQILKDLLIKAKQTRRDLKIGVFKVNTRARNLYASLGFELYDENQTHYLMQIKTDAK